MLLGLTSTAFANAQVNEAWNDYSVNRDVTVNVYGVGAKTDKNENSHAGMGIMFDSEAIKVKLEGTSDFIKLGTALKFNPFDGKLYMKVGGNYINQTMYAPDSTNTDVNQYSGAVALGYMFTDDLYLDMGGSYTNLDGKSFGVYEIKDEETSLVYGEIAKRWETAIGTLDTTANAGEVFHEYVSDEFSYGVGIDYYPKSNIKLAYNYQNEKNNIANIYAVQYSFLYAEYAENISMDTYQVNAGVKIAFDDLFDFSTWKAPTNIKSHLSELHRFETMTFANNMGIQSYASVQKIQAAIDRDNTPVRPPVTPLAISEPTISMANTSVQDDGGGNSNTVGTPTVSNVEAGAVYEIVSDPTSGMLTINSSTGAMTWDGDLFANTDFSITIKVTNTDTGTQSTTFTLSVEDNG